VHTDKDDVQCGGACVHCQNILTNQWFCDSKKTVLEEIEQAQAGSAIICVIQKFELTGSVCDKKGVVGRHRTACTQDIFAHIYAVYALLLWSPRKSVTQCSQSPCIKRMSTDFIM
jgi:hypothetical protein